MVVIFVAHASAFDFQHELYLPLQHTFSMHELILPHVDKTEPVNTNAAIRRSDLVLAEVTFPSTGVGIELGWANMLDKPIIALCRHDAKLSSSLTLIVGQVIHYRDARDMISQLQQVIH